MVTVDEAVLSDPVRLQAVDRARRAMPALPVPLDGIARLAARLLGAPTGLVTLVGHDEEYFAGVHGAPGALVRPGHAPIGYSVCQYMVSADRPVCSGDMTTDEDPRLREHPLVVEYGIRAFLGVPLRDGDDRPVGSITVLDTGVRHWSDEQMTMLVQLADLIPPAPAVRDLDAEALLDPSAPTSAEDEADRQRSFLTALLDSLSVGVIACDAGGRVVLINRALREAQHLPLTGRVTDRHVAAATAMLSDGAGRPMRPPDTPLMRAQRGEHVDDTDVVIHADGDRVRTFACNARPITGADGRRWGAVVAAHEVTELRRTEKFRACHAAVAEALAAAGSAAEAAPAMLEAVATTLQWPHAELWLVDEVTDALVPAGHWSAPGTLLDELAGHTVVKGEGITGQVWATGEPLWVPDITDTAYLRTERMRARVEACVRQGIRTVLSVPIRDSDTLLGVLTCYADAPEPHEDQLTVLLDGIAGQIGVFVALRRAEDLDRQLARSQDDFIALVGHELRTPLTSIAAYAAILADESGVADDDHRAMLRAVERNTIALRDIVDTLLDLAGLDSRHLTLGIQPCDIAAIAADCLRTTDTSAVRVRTDLPDHLLMDADPHRIRQVVEHLLSNAVAYSRPGDGVELHLSEDNGVVQLRVTDTGIGVPAGERQHLFDRFYRAGNVRHHGTPGAGLGLSLVHTIVKRHGGTITITDRHPTGTAVLVRLPQHAGRDEPGPGRPHAP